jgi:NADPH-dependent 2,4-dienoyl-CoA reductase/sulfur reductase-like enzyme
MNRMRTDRRRFLASAMTAGAAAAVFPTPALSQAAGARIVVIGGGFGGASCARALKRGNPHLDVSLVAPNAVYIACPMSNAVIAGLRDFEQQQFGYDAIRRDGVAVVAAAAITIDPVAKRVTLAEGSRLVGDRLVLAPGIDFRWDALPGYDAAAAQRMPHAWKDGSQIALLRRQLEAMDDGGLVVVSVPVTPARCPPAPYERASLIAHYLKTKKPRSKIIVLDAKDSFSMQRQFQAAWRELYSDRLEWAPLSTGGVLTSVDPVTNTLVTDFDKYRAAVANVIPAQKAGRIAELAGVADRTGWCPVDPVTFESKLQPGVHVIGDAAIAGAMPKSASAAAGQGKLCASAIVALLAGDKPAAPAIASACYSLLAPNYAIALTATYRPTGDQYVEVEGAASPPDAPPEQRMKTARDADAWFTSITGAVFA